MGNENQTRILITEVPPSVSDCIFCSANAAAAAMHRREIRLPMQTVERAGDDRHLDSLRLSVDKSQKEPGKEGQYFV